MPKIRPDVDQNIFNSIRPFLDILCFITAQFIFSLHKTGNIRFALTFVLMYLTLPKQIYILISATLGEVS
jgi:hypothetical protein